MSQLAYSLTPRLASSLRVKENLDFMTEWKVVADGCTSIFNTKPTVEQKMDLYDKVYRLASNPCRHVPTLVRGKESEKVQSKDTVAQQALVLYYLLRELFKDHIEKKVKPQLDAANILSSYVTQWRLFHSSLGCIRQIFLYLQSHWHTLNLQSSNGTATNNNSNQFNAWFLGMQLWNDIVLAPHREQLVGQAMVIVKEDREKNDGVKSNNNTISADSVQHSHLQLLKEVLESFVRIATTSTKPLYTYQEVFELNFLSWTESHYRSVADQLLLSMMPMKMYLETVMNMLNTEMKRGERYLDRSTLPLLRRSVLSVMVDCRLDNLLPHVDGWIQNQQPNSLQLLYLLTNQSEESLQQFAHCFEKIVVTRGGAAMALVAAGNTDIQRDPSPYILAIINTNKAFDNIVSEQFEGNAHLKKALDEGCRRYLNSNALSPISSGKSAQHLARFCNLLLRPNRELQQGDNNVTLTNSVLSIFKHLEDPDVFQAAYASFLSQRLIYGQCNVDAETDMIAKLRCSSTFEFTYKWSRMLADASTIAADLRTQFDMSCATSAPFALPFEFYPLVLTSGSWPSSMSSAEKGVPPPLVPVLDRFVSFYKTCCENRRLRWAPGLSHGVVTSGSFFANNKQYDFHLTQTQLMLIHLLNSIPQPDSIVQFSDLLRCCEAVTEDDINSVQRAISPFVRFHIVTLTAPESVPLPQQGLRINYSFSYSQRKVNLIAAAQPSVQVGATQPESCPAKELVAAPPNVCIERRLTIQSAIVRIMKAKRQAGYQELVQEVCQLLKNRFVPTPQDIKSNLELLIEKEYVERSTENPTQFSYLV